MKNYKIIKENGTVFEVNEEELFKIGKIWIENFNEFQEEGEEWRYPTDFSDVEEILIEYMNCIEVVEVEDKTVERDIFRIYHEILDDRKSTRLNSSHVSITVV